MIRLPGVCLMATLSFCSVAAAQVIEFESNGLKYQTLTKSGVTIIFARMPTHLHEYAVIQVAVSNGSQAPYVIRPADFSFVRNDGSIVRAAPSRVAVEVLRRKDRRNDIAKLHTAYQRAGYG